MPKLNEWLFGSSDKKRSNQTRQQREATNDFFNNPIQNNSTYQAGNSYLQNILSGDPSAFAAFEAPYMTNFEQNIVPQIAERFAGVGAGRSSGLNNSLGQAGSLLQQQLASLRSGLMQNAAGMGLQYAQQPYSNLLAGFTPQLQSYQPGSEGFTQGVGKAFAYGLGGSAGGFGSGGMGFGGGGGPPVQPYDFTQQMQTGQGYYY